MAERIVKLPDVGEGIAEAELVEWHVKVGDIIREDDLLAAVMTDKATVEIPAPVDGEVTWIGAEIGDTVAIGSALVKLKVTGEAGGVDAPAEDSAPADAEASEHAPASAPVPVVPPAKPPTADEPPRAMTVPRPTKALAATAAPAPALPRRAPGERPLASPAVRLKAREAGIDLRQLAGTGPAGRILPRGSRRLPAAWARSRAQARPLGEDRRQRRSRSSASGARSPRRWRWRRRASRTSPSSRRSTSRRSRICARSSTKSRRLERPKLTLLPFLMQRAWCKRLGRAAPTSTRSMTTRPAIVRQHAGIHLGIATQTPGGPDGPRGEALPRRATSVGCAAGAATASPSAARQGTADPRRAHRLDHHHHLARRHWAASPRRR